MAGGPQKTSFQRPKHVPSGPARVRGGHVEDSIHRLWIPADGAVGIGGCGKGIAKRRYAIVKEHS